VSDASLIPFVINSPSVLYFDVLQSTAITDKLLYAIAEHCYCIAGVRLYWASASFSAEVK
jgi:hypothetical protein